MTVNYGATPAAIEGFMDDIRRTASQSDAVVSGRTQVGISALGEAGVEVDFSCYVAVANATDEKGVKSRLMLEILRLAEVRGLGVGTPAMPAEPPPKQLERAAAD